MAKKPENFEWLGFTSEQTRLLNMLDHLGNNGWGRNPQSDAMMPGLLGKCADEGLSIEVIKQAMADIGYGKHALHQLDRWSPRELLASSGGRWSRLRRTSLAALDSFGH